MYEVFTDGACSGNPGPGGWSFLVKREGKVTLHDCGGESGTTNNRMELTAVIKALQSLPLDSTVKLYSDSQYIINTMTKNWQRKKNQDLWNELDKAVVLLNVSWFWIRGHDNHSENERCDRMAKEAVEFYR